MHRHLRPPEEQIQQAEFSSWVQTATPTTIIPALVRILDGNLNFVDYLVFSRRQSAKKNPSLTQLAEIRRGKKCSQLLIYCGCNISESVRLIQCEHWDLPGVSKREQPQEMHPAGGILCSCSLSPLQAKVCRIPVPQLGTSSIPVGLLLACSPAEPSASKPPAG